MAAEPSLWRREASGGSRSLWGRPSVIPLALLTLCSAGIFLPPIRDLIWHQPYLRSGISALFRGGMPRTDPLIPQSAITVLLWFPQAALMFGIVWHVARSWTAREEWRELSLTSLSFQRIALAKTFAPVSAHLLAATVLATVEVMVLLESQDVHWGSQHLLPWPGSALLWRLGHNGWWFLSAVRTYGQATREAFEPGALSKILLLLELPARTLLLGLTFATVTAWVSSRYGRHERALWTSLAVCTAIGAALLALDNWGQYHVTGGRTIFPRGSYLLGLAEMGWPTIRLEMVQDLSLHFLVPAIWLCIWWRWISRGQINEADHS